MSAVQLAVIGDPVTRVPLVSEPFWIGRDPACDLCVWDLRVSRRHARITRTRGEWLLASEGRNGVYLRSDRVPVLALRHGDEVALTPPDQEPPLRVRFENALEDVFVPDGVAVSSAWAEKLAKEPQKPGTIGRYTFVDPSARAEAPGAHLAKDRETGADVLVRVLSAAPDGHAADAWFHLVAAFAGASHPALPRVLDSGIAPVSGGLARWVALEPAKGRTAIHRISEGPQSIVTVVRRLRSLAGALHLLHSRGVVHGGVVASNVMLRPDGGATLLGLSRAYLRREGRMPASPHAGGDAPYVAPEARAAGALPSSAADVYGLAAVGRAMVFGDASGAPPPHAVVLPQTLEDALSRALSTDPDLRPTAEDFGRMLAFAEASLARASA